LCSQRVVVPGVTQVRLCSGRITGAGAVVQPACGRTRCDTGVFVFWQDYRCWCDLRKLELRVGERFLTHESNDIYWSNYSRDHDLPAWQQHGHADLTDDDRFNFNKSRLMPPSPS